MKFFCGIHQPNKAYEFERAFISVHSIKGRKKPFPARDWIMDSGAFTTIQKHGGYPEPVSAYAAEIRRWRDNGCLLAAVAQDYMCETEALTRTGLTIAEHQRLTIERYDALIAENTGVYIMPVLQGYAAKDYIEHLRQYGDRLGPQAWVGVGSVCKRNRDPLAIWKVLEAIKDARPDLMLHGFGIKKTALEHAIIRDMLYSADSMAWSYGERRAYRNPNDTRAAHAFVADVELLCAPEKPFSLT